MKKKFWEMNGKELESATARFDTEDAFAESRPLTEAEREQWRKAKRKRARGKAGETKKQVSIRMESQTLRRVNSLAKQRRVSRSKFLETVIEEAIAKAV